VKKSSTRKRFIPSFDILEGRTVPAGNITSTYFEGHLRLIGDDEANQIRIVPGATGGVTITALDDDTTINGEEGPVTISNVKGLAIALRDGDDVVEIDGLFLRKDLAINGQEGDDTITVQNTFVKYRGFLFGSTGDDVVNVIDSRFRRELQLYLGEGDDTFNFTGSRIGEESEIHGNAGDDTLNAQNNDWGEDTRASGFENRNSAVAPVANDDEAEVEPGGTVEIDVADNDVSVGGNLDLDSIEITEEPENGTVTVNDDGTVTYTHDDSATTSDSFSYTIKNANGTTSNEATVTITIDDDGGENVAPVANNDTATVAEGGNVSINVAANDTDSDGTLNLGSIIIFQNPANGTATVNANGTVTYTHNGSETTTDTFQYTIKDNDGTVSNVATVNVTITAGNDAPVAVNDTAQVAPSGTVNINVAANDTDSDGTLNLTTVTITTQPTSGTVTVNNDGTVTYTHNGTGTTDTFQYTIKDNTGATSNTATVTISIGNAPVANPDTATLNEGASTTINVSTNDTDSDGTLNLTSIVITQQPTRGTVTVNNNGSVTYTHNGSETTSDTFSYTIKDNQGLVSNAATVTITVTPVNDTPTATNDTLFVAPSGSATFNVTTNDTDPDGTIDVATVVITQQPTQGTVVVNGDGTVTYTRTGAGTTADSFRYTVKDNSGATSNVATVSVVVDVPPVANHDTATVSEGGTVSINLAANDTDSDGTLNLNSIVITQQPANGLVTVNANGTVSYTHNGSETTSDSFQYTIKDNQGATSNAATVSITVTPGNDAPVAVNDTGTAAQGASTTISVLANDTDADGTLNASTVTITTQPTNGSVVVNGDGTVTYTHGGGASTTDSFAYTVKDNAGATSNAATVAITIGAGNAAPVANADSAFVTPGGQAFINVSSNDTDSDGTLDLTSIVITQQPTNGQVIVNSNGTVTYIHNGDQTTSDSFHYTIKDDDGATSNAATVSITVNLAPVANDDTATVNQGQSTTINVVNNDTDVDGTLDLTSIVITTPPTSGSVTVNLDGTVTYTHDGSATVADSFAYSIKDNNGVASNPATVIVTISSPNNAAPTANGDAMFALTGGSGTGNVLSNDFDVDGTLDPATVTITVQPTLGTVTVNGDGTVTYTHTGTGEFDSFRYTVKDNLGATSNEASVTVFIHDAPVAANDSFQVNQGASQILAILTNDTASGGATIAPGTIIIVQQPTNGTVTVNGDGTVTYTNNGSATTSDNFTYTVKDSHGFTSNIATVDITILPPAIRI
jgi:large repetitive protein